MKDRPFSQKNSMITILLNSVIVLTVVVVAGTGILFGAGDGQVGDHVAGLGYFKPYTMDSNILAGIASLILVIYSLKSLRKKQYAVPRWAVTFHLMATSCLCLTFLVAALFLGPLQALAGGNYFTMFRNDMFFFHLLNPVLSALSFICLNREYRYSYRVCILSAVPTILYSIIYLVMVVVLKVWNDFYYFTFGGKYYMIPVVIVVIYALVLAASCGLIRLHNRRAAPEKAM